MNNIIILLITITISTIYGMDSKIETHHLRQRAGSVDSFVSKKFNDPQFRQLASLIESKSSSNVNNAVSTTPSLVDVHKDIQHLNKQLEEIKLQQEQSAKAEQETQQKLTVMETKLSNLETASKNQRPSYINPLIIGALAAGGFGVAYYVRVHYDCMRIY